MARWFSFAGFLALMTVGWVLFELTNVWPFNADRVPLLRILFGVSTVAATSAFLFIHQRLLPAGLMVAAFAVTSILSRATFNVPYIVSAAVVVMLIALVSRYFSPPLRVG
jgi:hypothetical protein